MSRRNKYNSWLYLKFLNPIFGFCSDFKWEDLKLRLTGRRFNLTTNDWDYIARLLADDYYVILTRRNAHLTTYLILIADWIKRPRLSWGHYSHATGNVTLAPRMGQLKFIEAVGGGVRESKFQDIFDCDSVCLLRPKGYSREDFKKYVAEAYENLGKPYDNALDVEDQSHMSCVEQVRDSLRQLPDYDDKMGAFEDMIWKERNLTPQMYYDCEAFEKVYEIRR